MRGLRQREIAERLEVDPSQIPKWEREQQGIRLDSLVGVLDALGAGMEEFGGIFDRARRGELLKRGRRCEEEISRVSDEGATARDGRPGRFTVVVWEEGLKGGSSQPGRDMQAGLEGVLGDVRYALDQLRPPEERKREESDSEPGGVLGERVL